MRLGAPALLLNLVLDQPRKNTQTAQSPADAHLMDNVMDRQAACERDPSHTCKPRQVTTPRLSNGVVVHPRVARAPLNRGGGA